MNEKIEKEIDQYFFNPYNFRTFVVIINILNMYSEPACGHCTQSTQSTLADYRLVGLVVKASASRAEDPGFESRLRRDFFGVESCQ